MSDSPSPDVGDDDAASLKRASDANESAYFRASLSVILRLLPIWFIVSFGCGILFRDWLDAHAPKIGNAPFGFWMAQQGSILTFIALLVVYAVMMNRLDRKHGFSEEK